MNKWIKLGERLRTYINPSTFPVTVKFLTKESSIPRRSKSPLRDMKVPMAPCQGSAMARRYGWTVAFAKEDVGCGIAAHTYGWNRVGDSRGPIHFLTQMNYAADERAAAEMIAGLPLLDRGQDIVVLYAPLERAEMEPDVVLIYVNPAQLMRLIHGATYKKGAASCTEGVIAAYLDQAPKVIVPGNGDRVWAGCQDHEMIMAIPGPDLADVVDGLEKTHRKGIRYPIPTYLRYRPEVAFTIPLSDVFLPEEVDKLKKK